MTIELEVKNFELFAKALNNACAVYGDMVSAINLGFEPQISKNKFSLLTNLPEGELIKRYNALVEIYQQVEEIEETMW